MMRVRKWSPHASVRRAPLYQGALNICILLKQKGFCAYLVGGWVRDLLLTPRFAPVEIDIATNASPAQIADIFKMAALVGQSFGVMKVLFKGFQYDVASFRVEGPYLDRRHPSFVGIGTMFQDSCRRDFKMNALYYCPLRKRIFDFHGGLNDIRNREVSAVGDPYGRIAEDALRILRVFRFAINLNFKIHPDLWNACL
jgi:tRNA nucleotidyltransferase/poly(A) polymerase